MADDSSPVGFLFEMQRESLRQSSELVESAIDLSADLGENVADGVETQQELQKQSLAFARESIHRSLDNVEAVSDNNIEGIPTPEGNVSELRETVDSTFDSLLDQQESAFERVDDEYGRFSDDLTENLNEQVDLLIEFNERIERQVTDLAEQFVEQAEGTDDLAEQLEAQLERLTDQFERQAERFSDLEDQFETIEISEGN